MSEGQKLHPQNTLTPPFSSHEEAYSLAVFAVPAQNDDYLTFFLCSVTFPHAPHASASSHKYPEPLALVEADLRFLLPYSCLVSLWVNLFSATNLSASAFAWCASDRWIWFGNKANIYLTLKPDKYATKNYRTVSFMNIDTKSSINYSKLNPAAYKKDYTPWPGGIYPRNTRVVQHTKNNQYSTSH